MGSWAVDHYRKYGRPPGNDIVGYLDAWAETAKDKETIQAAESLLASLSGEYQRLKDTCSPNYLLDQAAMLFNRVRLAELRDLVEAELDNGNVEQATTRVLGYRRMEIGLGAGVSVLSETEAVYSAFEARSQPLITYPGALGDFFADAFARDNFISFVGIDKIGKSFWLQDLAVRGVEQGRNVAYFEMGDMSQAQVIRRFASRAAGRPIKAGRYDYPVSMDPPVGENARPRVVTEIRDAYEDMTPEEGIRALAKLRERSGGDLRLSCHPAATMSVMGVEGILEQWERDGWRPDVIVLDYADLMAPQPADVRADVRDQINGTWISLRALSQKSHTLVVTTTQADAAAYNAPLLSRTNFSGDKRKNAHVTAMIGINQSNQEKKAGLYRLNAVNARELDQDGSKVVWTAACLAVGNPAVDSIY